MAAASNGPDQKAGKSGGRGLIIRSDNFIHMNEGNIKTFYKISSCIGRGKHILSFHQNFEQMYTLIKN